MFTSFMHTLLDLKVYIESAFTFITETWDAIISSVQVVLAWLSDFFSAIMEFLNPVVEWFCNFFGISTETVNEETITAYLQKGVLNV